MLRTISFIICAVIVAGAFVYAFRRLPASSSSFNADAAVNADETNAEASSAAEPAAGSKPVIVELFTSEGCSSCPPADAVLSLLDKTQPVAGAEVIVLSQHVDYWNNLGWTDPFSSHGFSERQSDYSRAFGKDGVYTPQMVIDGQTEFPGGNRGMALQTIARAARTPKADVQVTGTPDGKGIKLAVRVEHPPQVSAGDTAEVLLALTESNLASSVGSGENSGRRLTHVGVVRRLSVLGNLTGAAFTAEPIVALDGNWRRANVRAVVFVQERTSKRILGAASYKLAS